MNSTTIGTIVKISSPFEQHAQVAVALQHGRGREREAHQQRPPEEEHREGDDVLAIAARAAHLPDLIHGPFDGQEEPEGDEHEQDPAQRRRRSRVLREAPQVIGDLRRLIGDDRVEDGIDLRLCAGEDGAEGLLQNPRERHHERDQREQRRVGQRGRARAPFDVPELPHHFAHEEKELDDGGPHALLSEPVPPIDEHGRIGQPRPDQILSGHELAHPSLARRDRSVLWGLAHGGRINAMVAPARVALVDVSGLGGLGGRSGRVHQSPLRPLKSTPVH